MPLSRLGGLPALERLAMPFAGAIAIEDFRVGVNQPAPQAPVHVRYTAANNDPAVPAVIVDARGGSQAVLAFHSSAGGPTLVNIVRGDSTGQLNIDAAGQVVIKTAGNSVYNAVFETSGKSVFLGGIYGEQAAAGSLILGSNTSAGARGVVAVPSDLVLIGSSTDMTGGVYTTGLQIGGASSGALALARTVAHASTTLATIGAFNGTTRVSSIDVSGSGTTGGSLEFSVKGASTAIASVLRLPGTLPVSGETAILLAYHNGTGVTVQRVTVGAADSGAAGFKLLRVPN